MPTNYRLSGNRVLAVAFLLAAGSAQALVISHELDFQFSTGGTAPEGAAPWLTATYEDTGPGTVEVTLEATNLSDSEFVSEWYLNVVPGIDPTLLDFSAVDVADVGSYTIDLAESAFKADGDGWFDVLVSFPSGPPSARFDAGNAVVFDVTHTDPLFSALSFDWVSSEVAGTNVVSADLDENGTPKFGIFSAAHVQSIGEGGDSGWAGSGSMPVPEPSTYAAVFGLVAGLLVLVRRR